MLDETCTAYFRQPMTLLGLPFLLVAIDHGQFWFLFALLCICHMATVLKRGAAILSSELCIHLFRRILKITWPLDCVISIWTWQLWKVSLCLIQMKINLIFGALRVMCLHPIFFTDSVFLHLMFGKRKICTWCWNFLPVISRLNAVCVILFSLNYITGLENNWRRIFFLSSLFSM